MSSLVLTRTRSLVLLSAFALALPCSLGSLAPSTASAQRPDPDQGELERRVAALQASHSTLPPGSIRSIAYTVEHAADIRQNFSEASRAWRRRAARYLDRAEAGHDPFQEEAGKLTARAYRSPISQRERCSTMPAIPSSRPDIPPSPTPEIPSSVSIFTIRLSWADEQASARKSGTRRTMHSTLVIFMGLPLPWGRA